MGSKFSFGRNWLKLDKKSLIIRQRISPKIWDFSYLMLKENLNTFLKFKDLLIREKKYKVLDVGCGHKPWKRLLSNQSFQYTGVDVDTYGSPDIVASVEELPFPDNSFDAIICSEVLEHVFDIDKAINELIRVCRNNGLIYISTPFIFPIHAHPYDYFRFTKYFYEKKFEKHDIISIKNSNSTIATVFLVPNFILEYFVLPWPPFLIVKYFFTSLLNILALVIDYISKPLINYLIQILPLEMRQKASKQLDILPLGYSMIIRVKK